MIAAILLLALGLAAALGCANALRPVRHWLLVLPSWAAAWLTIELAAHLIVLSGVLAGVLVLLGGLEHPIGVVGLGLLVVADVIGAIFAFRAIRSAVIARQAIADLDPDPETPRFPRSHIVFPFLMRRRRGVRTENGIVYARDGVLPLKLDVYQPAERTGELRPAVVQVHGGAWVSGTRKEQGIPLLNHLAANGWVGFNINYRLSPYATWPEHAIDVKRAIAWVREHAEEYDVDPNWVAITGGSAGGHITAFVALTANERSLQPGFEDADTSVAAAVPFYGIYDMLNSHGMHVPAMQRLIERFVFKEWRDVRPDVYRDASPLYRIHADAPPFFVIHGDRDSLAPIEEARAFVERLREVSSAPVIYAEIKGAQHAFDVIPSLRTAPVIEAIERFLHAVRRREVEESDEREVDAAVAAGSRS